MKLCCCLLAGLIPSILAAEEGHDNNNGNEGRSCACVAEELGFDIDCDNQAIMVEAMTTLLANGCDSDCSSDVCTRNYYIIQSHHDYCLHDEIPEPIEDGIHTLEGMCDDCSIVRKTDLLLPDCPTVSCSDGSGDVAFQSMLSTGCLDFCNTDSCGENYRILRAVHDTCPEEALSINAEQGLHDLEDPCELYDCNVGASDRVQKLVCSEEDDHDNDSVESSAVKAWSRLGEVAALGIFSHACAGFVAFVV